LRFLRLAASLAIYAQSTLYERLFCKLPLWFLRLAASRVKYAQSTLYECFL
jgi:hypothetical protein